MRGIKLVQRSHIILHLAVSLILEEEPVETSEFSPLSALCKLLSHEEKLLSGMSIHVSVGCAERGKLIALKSGHLVEHRAFAVYDLIV